MAARTDEPSAPAAADGMAPVGESQGRVLRQRYGVLFVATIALLCVQGALQPSGAQQVIVTALAGLTLLLALRAADLRPRFIAGAGALTAVAIAVSAVQALGGGIGEGAALVGNAALVALGPPAVAVGLIRDLRASGQVRLPTVMGVLCFYTLVGMLFAFVYGAIDRFGSGPFFAGGDTATISHCLYFSFTTLMTVGYGDYVARTDTGHTIAVMEALLGQIYLVTVVSLIVSNLGAPARRVRER
jgi:hypothetical protein